jgi:hypothetical protein
MRGERKPIFSARPYRPEQVAKDRMLHQRDEETRRKMAKSEASDIDPWNDPNLVPHFIEPEEISQVRASRKPVAQRDRQMETKQRSRLLEAIDLKTYIEKRNDLELSINPQDKNEQYAYDLEMIETLIAGLRERPEDTSLAEQIKRLEERYRPSRRSA